MTVLDWAIVAFTLSFAMLGRRRGPIAGPVAFLSLAAVALALVWLAATVVLHSSATSELRPDVRRSLIVRELNGLLPPPDPLLEAIDRVDTLPSIAGPTTPVAPPDAAIASDPDIERAGLSVVRVLGTACGLGVEGSGWVAAPGLVVTNAHVVAGEDDTTIATQDGASFEAVPVLYEPGNDLAVLRIEADLPALPIAEDPRSGTGGAVLGYPENGPFAASPARLGETQTAISQDSYGNGPIHRQIAFLRGRVRSGNSGGPLVDSAGRVLGTLFASTTSGQSGGFAIPNDIVLPALARATNPVDTGPCTG
jgi:S1-C subfamily serine protease